MIFIVLDYKGNDYTLISCLLSRKTLKYAICMS